MLRCSEHFLDFGLIVGQLLLYSDRIYVAVGRVYMIPRRSVVTAILAWKGTCH